MTGYGLAIKVLPQGGKPFVEEDDENEGTEETPLDKAAPGISDTEPAEDFEEDLPEDPAAAPAAIEEDPAAPADDPTAPPTPDTPPEGEGGGAPNAAPEQPDDASRPWAGDEYNEGDETDPRRPRSLVRLHRQLRRTGLARQGHGRHTDRVGEGR
ncbi:hypothetical protein ACWCPM_30105 [Streptomyces sp. NPDC002309]